MFDWDGTAVPDRRSDATEVRAPRRGPLRGWRPRVRGQWHRRRQHRRSAAGTASRTGPAPPVPQPRLGGVPGRTRRSRAGVAAYGDRRRGARAGPSRRPWLSSGSPARGMAAQVVVPAAEPPQDRPDPRTGVGGPAEGTDRRAPRRRHRSAAGRRRRRPLRGRRDRRRRRRSEAGPGRPADHQRRQARRDRAHRQVRLGPLGGAVAGRARASPAGWSWSSGTSSARSAAFRAAMLSCSCPSWPGPSSSRWGSSPAASPPVWCTLGGGPARLLGLLDAQLARRRDRRVPTIDDDPAWVVALPEEETMRRAAEALGTLANGWAGLRAAREEDGPGTLPLVRRERHLHRRTQRRACWPVRSGPSLTVSGAGRDERLLDLRTGVLLRTGRDGSPLRTLRFVSAADPWFMALRAEGSAVPARVRDHASRRRPTARRWSSRIEGRPASPGPRIRTAAGSRSRPRTRSTTVATSEWSSGSAAWVADGSRPPDWEEAAARLAEAERLGFDRLLAEHREAWAHRWADAEVRIEGGAGGRAGGPVRHVPPARRGAGRRRGRRRRARPDRARVRRSRVLGRRRVRAACARRHPTRRGPGHARVPHPPAARRSGCGRGRQVCAAPGSRGSPPADGSDVTPAQRPRAQRRADPHPHRRAARSHIVADVAWAACEYAAWTGDAEFLQGAGGQLIVETARYWASRVRDRRRRARPPLRPDGARRVPRGRRRQRLHQRHGPLEPPPRRPPGRPPVGGDAAEAERWRRLSGRWSTAGTRREASTSSSPATSGLEPLLVADVAPPPVAADVCSARERVAGSQLIKQADVVMLHHLVPDEVVPGSLARRTSPSTSRAPPTAARCLPPSTPRSSLAPASRSGRSSCSASPPVSTSTTSPAPPPAASTSPPWVASGRRSPTASSVFARGAGGSTSTRACLAPGRRSSSGSGSAVTASGCGPATTPSASAAPVPLRLRIAGRPPEACLPPGGSFPLHGSDR